MRHGTGFGKAAQMQSVDGITLIEHGEIDEPVFLALKAQAGFFSKALIKGPAQFTKPELLMAAQFTFSRNASSRRQRSCSAVRLNPPPNNNTREGSS